MRWVLRKALRLRVLPVLLCMSTGVPRLSGQNACGNVSLNLTSDYQFAIGASDSAGSYTAHFLLSGDYEITATLANGVAQLTTSAVTVGSHVVAVTYTGDANYLPSTYQALKQIVNP